MDGAAYELESGCKEKEKEEQSLHKMWDTLLIEMEYDELFQPFDNTERKVCTCIFFQGFIIIIYQDLSRKGWVSLHYVELCLERDKIIRNGRISYFFTKLWELAEHGWEVEMNKSQVRNNF